MTDAETAMRDIGMLTWVDQDLMTGDGIIIEILPECFVLGKDGLEHVAFGKVVSWEGGPDNLLPVAQALTDKLIKAAEECPSEAVFVEVTDDLQKPEKYWHDFFANNFKWIRDNLKGSSLNDEEREQLVRYVASLIMPDDTVNLGVKYASDFDVLSYMNAKGSEDTAARKHLADQLLKNSSDPELFKQAVTYF